MIYLEHRNKLLRKFPLHTCQSIHLQAITLLASENVDFTLEQYVSLQASEVGIPACRDSSIQGPLLSTFATRNGHNSFNLKQFEECC